MAKKIDVGITITIDNQKYQLSIDEARELYLKLAERFKEKQPEFVPLPLPYPIDPERPWYSPTIT